MVTNNAKNIINFKKMIKVNVAKIIFKEIINNLFIN